MPISLVVRYKNITVRFFRSLNPGLVKVLALDLLIALPRPRANIPQYGPRTRMRLLLSEAFIMITSSL